MAGNDQNNKDESGMKRIFQKTDRAFGIPMDKALKRANWMQRKQTIAEGIQNVRRKIGEISFGRVILATAIISTIALVPTKIVLNAQKRGIEREVQNTRMEMSQMIFHTKENLVPRTIEKYHGLINSYKEDYRGFINEYIANKVRATRLGAKIEITKPEIDRYIEGKKKEIADAEAKSRGNAPKPKDPEVVKQEIRQHERAIAEHSKRIEDMRKKLITKESGWMKDPKVQARINVESKKIEECRKAIYSLDPDRMEKCLASPGNANPMAGVQESKILGGTVTGMALYEFPISRNYEMSRLRTNAPSGDTVVSDFERVTVTDMCNFPFSLVRLEWGLHSAVVVDPHTAYRPENKVLLTVRPITGRKVTYQEIINSVLGNGYTAMQNADVEADYIMITGERRVDGK